MNISEYVEKGVTLTDIATVALHGYVIDNRGIRPLLMKGQWAIEFNSNREAYLFALNQIFYRG